MLILLSEIEEQGTKNTIAYNIIPNLNFSLIFRYHHLWESARERLSQWVKEDKLQVHGICYIIHLFDIEISLIEKKVFRMLLQQFALKNH